MSSEEQINELSRVEQSLQQINGQLQNFRSQLLEIETALSELNGKDDAYKIIGTVMIKLPSTKIVNELKERQELLTVRIESLKKQEARLKERADSLRKDIMKTINRGDENGKEG